MPQCTDTFPPIPNESTTPHQLLINSIQIHTDNPAVIMFTQRDYKIEIKQMFDKV